MRESSENRPVAGLSTNRLEAFSDGVFAVAITLLVLNLQVPQLASASELVSSLGALWPKLLSYALSFVIVGIYWVAHHNTFHYIKRSDRNLLWLNILLLMCIVFLPFPTALLGQYPEQRVSIIIYAGTLVITGLVLQALWWYATSRYRLVDRNIDPRLVQRATRRNLTAPLIYLLAIGISSRWSASRPAWSCSCWSRCTTSSRVGLIGLGHRGRLPGTMRPGLLPMAMLVSPVKKCLN